MAHVSSCDICKRQTINHSRCAQCEQAVLIDILARVQKALRDGKCLIFDDVLKRELRQGSFETFDEYLTKIDPPKVVLPVPDGMAQQTIKVEVPPDRGPVIGGTYVASTEQWSGHQRIRPDGEEGS